MRRLTMSLLSGLVLLTATARPAAADGWKEYVDCIKFTTIWCDLTREEVNNVIEYMAVETYCGILYLKCTLAAF